MLEIKIVEELKAKWKDVVIGSLQGKVIVKPSQPELIKKLDSACTKISEEHKLDDISKLKPITDSRKAYKALGKDPARYRLSSEALLRRIVKEKGIYKINNIVDINNLLSITSFYSICAFDLSKIEAPVAFTIGTKADVYNGIGRGLLNIENLPVFSDQMGKFGSPTSDSERVKISNETNAISMNIISFSGSADLDLQLIQLKEYLVQYADAQDLETRIVY